MAGISSFGAYVPLWRLGPETKGWTSPVERSVASYDEDSVTMAVAASINCLDLLDRHKVDALYFASTTPPYKEKQAAVIVAAATDLRHSVFTADFTGTTRAGTIALRAAIDAVKAGSAKQVLVVAADMRPAMARSGDETSFGDGAVAVLVEEAGVAVAIEDSLSISDEILDVWRADGETYERSWEDRFVIDEGYMKVLAEAVSALTKQREISPKDLTKAVIYAPDARRHADMARRLGLDVKAQVADPLFNVMGNTGSAYALMVLTSVLEETKEGDGILLANYGNGADVFLLRANEGIEKARQQRTMQDMLQSKKVLDSYDTYAKWRGLIQPAPSVRRPPLQGPSATAYWRERDQNIRLYGVKCLNCGYVQYPPQRVCTNCHTKDQFESVRFSDKKGEIFTYSMDYLGATVDPPLAIAVVNFKGGGRMLTQVTDRDPAQLKVGIPVEMSFRRLYSADGIHNYYWKSMPIRV